MNPFATQPAFTQPASQPVLRFLGSPEQLLVSGQQSGGEFQGPRDRSLRRQPCAPSPPLRQHQQNRSFGSRGSRPAGRAGGVAGRGRVQPARPALSGLIGERATRSETFRTWWAAHNVRLHRTGVKRLDLAPPRRSFLASGSPVLSQ
jgi:hypothetical protein